MQKTFLSRITALTLFVLSANSCLALNSEKWDLIRMEGLPAGKLYSVSSGTGFFITSNMIVTSRHVVDNCLNIAVRGAIDATKVKIISENIEDDLALLYSPLSHPKVAQLRNNYQKINKNDIIFTIGYPLERGESGLYILKSAKILNVKKKTDSNFTEIEFSDSVDHGNSGGPILDNNGNIIGIVAAKGVYRNLISHKEEIVGIGVGLDALINFLNRNKVNYLSSNTYDILVNYRADIEAKNYILNVHCIKERKN